MSNLPLTRRDVQFHNPHASAAYAAGKADALAGKPPDGWEYSGGTCEDAYRLGWLSASKLPSDRDVMDAMLEALQAGLVEPVVRLSDEEMDESKRTPGINAGALSLALRRLFYASETYGRLTAALHRYSDAAICKRVTYL